jgi:hypothetical protein
MPSADLPAGGQMSGQCPIGASTPLGRCQANFLKLLVRLRESKQNHNHLIFRS